MCKVGCRPPFAIVVPLRGTIPFARQPRVRPPRLNKRSRPLRVVGLSRPTLPCSKLPKRNPERNADPCAYKNASERRSIDRTTDDWHSRRRAMQRPKLCPSPEELARYAAGRHENPQSLESHLE